MVVDADRELSAVAAAFVGIENFIDFLGFINQQLHTKGLERFESIAILFELQMLAIRNPVS